MVWSNSNKNNSSFSNASPSAAPTFANASKNSSTFTAISISGQDKTWDEATYAWDDAQGTWDSQRNVYAKLTKNSSTFSELSKS